MYVLKFILPLKRRRDYLMLSKIEYVYGKDKTDEVQLLGAKVFSFNGVGIQSKEFYVGISYNIDEVCSDINLANSIGIANVESLKRKFMTYNAAGIIYFPQANRYDLLEADDTVIPFQNDLTVEEVLEENLAPFRKNTTTKEAYLDYINVYYGDLDPEDPRREFLGLPLSRKVSAR